MKRRDSRLASTPGADPRIRFDTDFGVEENEPARVARGKRKFAGVEFAANVGGRRDLELIHRNAQEIIRKMFRYAGDQRGEECDAQGRC